jgi:phosphatidylglycerophosphatase A
MKEEPAPAAVHKVVATFFFCGYAPLAPGTVGSAACAVLYYFLCPSLGPWAWLALLVIASAVGVWAAAGAALAWGKDPGRVVVDEAVGMLFSLAFLPNDFWTVLIGFCLFRLFDISKPPPIRRFERLPGGWGIVADDIAAGVYANLVGRVVLAYWL